MRGQIYVNKSGNSTSLQLFFIMILVVMGFAFSSPINGLSDQQWRTVLLLIISVFLWSTNVLSTGVSSMFVVGMILLFDLADTFSDAVSGFLATAIYFVFVVSMISQVMMKAGLDKVMARFIFRLAAGNVIRTTFGFLLAMMVLPIFMPSAAARVRMFLPLINQLNESYGLPEQSAFNRFCIWTLGGLNQVLTIIVFTGGGYAILASEMLTDLGYSLTWTSWLLHMLPPVYLAVFITAFFMFFYFGVARKREKGVPLHNSDLQLTPPATPREAVNNNTAINRGNEKKRTLLVSLVLMLMLVSWFFGGWVGIPAILPPIFALVIYSLPGFRLISDEDVRKYDWENFLLIGSAISLSEVVQKTGTADWLAKVLFALVPESLPSAFGMIFLIIIVLALRFAFVGPSAAITVILPLAVTFGSELGLPVLTVSLLTTLIVGSLVIMPIHSQPMLLAYYTGVFTMKDQWFIGSILLIAVTLSGILAANWLW